MTSPKRSNARAQRRLAATATFITVILVFATTRAIKRSGDLASVAAARESSSLAAPIAAVEPAGSVAESTVATTETTPSATEAPPASAGTRAVATRRSAPVRNQFARNEGAKLGPSPSAQDDVDATSPSDAVKETSQSTSTAALLNERPTSVESAGPGGIGPGLTPPAATINWRALASLPGVSFEASMITDASVGTADLGEAHAMRAHTAFSLALDLDSLFGWRGLTVYAQEKIKRGRNASSKSELVQSFSNIDAEDFRLMGEVFIEQRVLDDRLRVRLGRLDFNSDFAATDHGGDFLNASMGFSPSITGAPTYPLPSAGVSVVVSPRDYLSVSVAGFDGRHGAPAPDGGSSRFLIGQLNLQWSPDAEARTGRLGVGTFHHSGVFPLALGGVSETASVEPGTTNGTDGWYATLDQNLWQGSYGTADAKPLVGAFLQLGRSDSHVDAIRGHVGGGLTFAGLIPQASSGTFGIGATRASWAGGSEAIGEIFHRQPLFGGLTLTSDFQRVYQHDALGSHRVGNIFSLRTIVSF